MYFQFFELQKYINEIYYKNKNSHLNIYNVSKY